MDGESTIAPADTHIVISEVTSSVEIKDSFEHIEKKEQNFELPDETKIMSSPREPAQQQPRQSRNDTESSLPAYQYGPNARRGEYVVYYPEDATRAPAYRGGRYRDDYDDNNGRNRRTDQVDRFAVSFDDVFIRNRFVQRVYSILTVQLFFSMAYITTCVCVHPIKHFLRHDVLPSMILMGIALGVMLTTLMCITYCMCARRNFPINFIVLFLFTWGETHLCAFMSAYYETWIVLTAFGITAGVTFVISIFACQTRWDVTGCGMFLCIFGMIVMIFGMIAMIVGLILRTSILFIIYASLAAFMMSMYLMYDTQQIMGGRKIELNPEEYIFGALTLYSDIMGLFIMILTLFGLCRG